MDTISSEKCISSEWYNYGLKHNDDCFIKYMMHWIAFNWLYNGQTERFEHHRIISFCYNNIDKLNKYNAFATSEYLTLKHSNVKDARTGKIKSYIQKAYDELLARNDITSLFLILYQIRCNLFHGSKTIHCERDIDLVRASSVILEGYLKVLIEK